MSNASSWILHKVEGDLHVLYPTGVWRLANLVHIDSALRALTLNARRHFLVDGSGLEELDTAACFTIFRYLSVCGCTETTVTTRAFKDEHKRLLALVHERMQCPPAVAKSRHFGLVRRIGVSVIGLLQHLKTQNAFNGSVTLEMLRLIRQPRLFRIRETVSQFETICLNAIPVVCLVTLLIGVVFAYLLGIQTQQYGANIFVVDGVGLAVCRELSPILVSIIVAGRSGASFTAQIGTMKVQEEIDAITTLGLSPIQTLVIPRLVAIVVALPLLVFIGDLAGIVGGVVVAALELAISPSTFLNRLQSILPMSAFVVGMVKAPIFATAIAIIGCRMGMLVARDAHSVGVNTTSTVVQSVVWVILLDAAFAVAFQLLGI
jgi:phospholipid/cholesterol/gamma-HCH transport system permease protein